MTSARLNAVRALGLGLVCLCACTKTPYVEATTKYAQSLEASVGVAQESVGLAKTICIEKATYTYLQVRLAFIAPDQDVPWSMWYAKASAARGSSTEKVLTWQQYCAEIGASSDALADALGVIGSYASALGDLAGKADYDGADVKALAESAGSLAGDTKAGRIIKALAEPLKALAISLTAAYTEGKIKELAAEAGPHIQKIILGAKSYLSALEEDLVAVEGLQGPSMNVLEQMSFPPLPNLMSSCRADAMKVDDCKVDPVRLRSFMAWSQELQVQSVQRHTVFAQLSATLTSISKTQTKFEAASPSDFGVVDVFGAVLETMTHVNAVRAALSGETKESE